MSDEFFSFLWYCSIFLKVLTFPLEAQRFPQSSFVHRKQILNFTGPPLSCFKFSTVQRMVTLYNFKSEPHFSCTHFVFISKIKKLSKLLSTPHAQNLMIIHYFCYPGVAKGYFKRYYFHFWKINVYILFIILILIQNSLYASILRFFH